MVTESQVQLADVLWAQGKKSVQLAYDSFRLLAQSQKALLTSYQSAGLPVSAASHEVEKHMKAHEQAFEAALNHLLEIEQAHREVLRQFNTPGA